MATVAVNEFVFKQPVRWATSCRFYSKVDAHRQHLDHGHGGGLRRAQPAQGAYVKVTEANLTYVAIDDNGRPRPIEGISCAQWALRARPGAVAAR